MKIHLFNHYSWLTISLSIIFKLKYYFLLSMKSLLITVLPAQEFASSLPSLFLQFWKALYLWKILKYHFYSLHSMLCHRVNLLETWGHWLDTGSLFFPTSENKWCMEIMCPFSVMIINKLSDCFFTSSHIFRFSIFVFGFYFLVPLLCDWTF